MQRLAGNRAVTQLAGRSTMAKGDDGVTPVTIQRGLFDRIRGKKKAPAGQGSVAVLDGDDWLKSYYQEFPEELPDKDGPDDEQPAARAFTTTKPPVNVIIVHKDRGDPGTVVHEGMHLYQNDAVGHACGPSFNEGITELMTRKVTDALGIERGGYENNSTP